MTLTPAGKRFSFTPVVCVCVLGCTSLTLSDRLLALFSTISWRIFFSAAINLISLPCAIELTTPLSIHVSRHQNAIGLKQWRDFPRFSWPTGCSIGTFAVHTLRDFRLYVNSGVKSRKEFSENSCLVAHVEFIVTSAFRQLAAQRMPHQSLNDRPGILSRAIKSSFPSQSHSSVTSRTELLQNFPGDLLYVNFSIG